MIRTICLLLFFININCYAQYSNVEFYTKDSMPKWERVQLKLDKRYSHDLFQMCYAAVPLVAGGLIVKGKDHYFTDLRNQHVPSFKYTYDDIIEYVPAVAMLGLKIGGIEGRSSWGRMLVSDAFSVALVAGTVNSLKYTTKVMRPDGSKRNSFPSGHTAVAFMTATMLHKEYGLTRSPWYSVGGYTIATATGVSRMLNNRHWLSDVLAGAGIGIITTEMGYFLADLIFKEKGIKSDYLQFESFRKTDKPSHFGLFMGFDLMQHDITLAPNLKVKPHTGSSAGFEGAWFMNPYIGIGGRFLASSIPLQIKGEGLLPSDLVQKTNQELQSFAANVISTYVGPSFSYPVANRILLGTKLHIGGCFSPTTTISSVYKEQNQTELQTKEFATVEKSFHIGYNTNASITYVMKHNLGLKVFLDYKLTPTRFVTNLEEKYEGQNRFEERNTMHTFTLGASVNVMLW